MWLMLSPQECACCNSVVIHREVTAWQFNSEFDKILLSSSEGELSKVLSAPARRRPSRRGSTQGKQIFVAGNITAATECRKGAENRMLGAIIGHLRCRINGDGTPAAPAPDLVCYDQRGTGFLWFSIEQNWVALRSERAPNTSS